MAEFHLIQKNYRLQGDPFLVFAKRETPDKVILQFKIAEEIIGESTIDLANGNLIGINGEEFKQMRLVNVAKFLPLPSTEMILIVYTCMGV